MIFAKSQWAASVLLALLIFLSACGGGVPLSNVSSLSNTDKVIVYVPGLTEALSSSDIAKNNGYGMDGSFFASGAINPYLKSTAEFKGAATLLFSYGGFTVDGKPNTFKCNDTFENLLSYDIALLKLQIIQYVKAHLNIKHIYLVGHSLGGVVIFGYLAQLIEWNSKSNVIADAGKTYANIDGAAFEDAPFGGVTNNRKYVAGVFIASFLCEPFYILDSKLVQDFQGIFNKTPDTSTARGADASVLGYLGGSKISNQTIASDAASKGVKMVVIGNTNDMLWDGLCAGPNFTSTEFLSEFGKLPNDGALYVRSFTYPAGILDRTKECPMSLETQGYHATVLTDKDSQQLIWEVFAGSRVDKLTVYPFSINVTPTDTKTFVPTPDLSGGTPNAPSASLKPTPGINPTIQPTKAVIGGSPTAIPTPIPSKPTATPMPTPRATPTLAPTDTPVVPTPTPTILTGYVWPGGKLDQQSTITVNQQSTPISGGGYTISGSISIGAPVSVSGQFTGIIDGYGNKTLTFAAGGDTYKFDSSTSAGTYYINGNEAGTFSLG